MRHSQNARIFAVSPDHSQFLIGQFTRRDEEMPLWLWPVQGGEPRRLGKATGHDPAWSPDAMQIVFVQGQDLYSVRRDGTQLRKLLHVAGRSARPGVVSRQQIHPVYRRGERIRNPIDLGSIRGGEQSAPDSGGREPSRRDSLPELGRQTANISFFRAANNTTAICGR